MSFGFSGGAFGNQSKQMNRGGAGHGSCGGNGTGGGGGQGGGVGGGGMGDLPGVANGGLFTIDGSPINTTDWRTIEIELNPNDDQFDAVQQGSDTKDKIKGTVKNDYIKGYEHNDHLDGHKGHDHLRGGAGDDTLKGGAGNDLLIGAIDHDQLKGHKGKDILFGGDGKDKMEGGKGKDVFILSRGNDMIKDFNLNQDSLGIENNAGLSIELKQKGKNLLLKSADGIHTTLKGINRNDFVAAIQDVNTSVIPGVLIEVF